MTRTLWTKNQELRLRKSIYYLTFLLLLASPYAFGQLSELEQQFEEAESSAATIADSLISIVKIIAGVALVISALTFLLIRNQESDFTKKLGTIVIGIGIFYALLTIAENFMS